MPHAAIPVVAAVIGAVASRNTAKQRNKLEARTTTKIEKPNMVRPLDFLDEGGAFGTGATSSTMPFASPLPASPLASPLLPAAPSASEEQQVALRSLLSHLMQLSKQRRLGLGDPTLPPKEY
jgi:hypothetical protein